MATLLKFKHMATHCAVMGGGSPSRNPTTSPIILRRRRRHRTLRMFLGRAPSDCRRRSPKNSPALPPSDGAGENGDIDSGGGGEVGARVRHKLKDLFISTSLEDETGEEDGVEERRGQPHARLLGSGGAGVGMRRFRCRLMRTSWRPVLVAIPE